MSRRLPPIILALLLVLTGCASHDQGQNAQSSSATPETEATFPVTIGSVTIKAKPARIVSLSPSATETLFALSAGPQVVAVDSQSDYPPQAPHTQLSSLNPDPEAIAGYHPDLVVASADENGLGAALGKIGVPLLVMADAKSLADAYGEFVQLGKATGHQAEGESLATQVGSDIDQIVASTPKPAQPLTYYYELDQTYYTATSATFIGSVLSRFGLKNIADGNDPGVSGGYPQLSAERILQSNPDLIFLADTKCCGQNAQSVGARPGWSTLTAVRAGHVFPLDDDIASRWSPRIVDLVRDVSDAVTKAR